MTVLLHAPIKSRKLNRDNSPLRVKFVKGGKFCE